MSTRNIKFGVDLITFYNPGYWGGSGGLNELGKAIRDGGWEPGKFWDRILDDVQKTGMDGIEITFPPGDFFSAQQAYGSAKGFATALRDRGLALAAGFFVSRRPDDGRRLDFLAKNDQNAILELTEQYAAFLNTCGADVLVTALPDRKSRDAEPPGFVSLKVAERFAEIFNRMGAAAIKHGVRLALHPEAFSMFRNRRDVDLFMTLTDPTYVHLCPDTAQFVVAGSDPIRIVDYHRERVVLTHWKDAVGAAPVDTIIDETIYARQVRWFTGLGEGVVDWRGWMRLLRDMRYQGWALFELDLAVDPIAELIKSKQFVEKTLSHIYL